ncbi:aldolase [Aspergillus ellipticus CBS 707.79]|uniref:porphobilinogen synthase n=1 Tax=Aspergillus ellipticus CBS 707.79 TaxID=1448320 RepID=A0A319D9Z9_9EURO|nr:aldolase [Aspergillus ellipticus CBS 707.79]
MAATNFPASTQVTAPTGSEIEWPRDGTAQITSPLKSGYNHAVSAMWQAERHLHKSMFIFPVFLSADPDREEPITSLPNQHRRGVNKLLPFLATLVAKGLHSIILFGSPPSSKLKDASGSMADHPNGPIIPAIPLIRKAFPNLYVVADVSLCEYTDHGHCAVCFDDGTVDNEASVERISDISLSFAQAGVHCVAPPTTASWQNSWSDRASARSLVLNAAESPGSPPPRADSETRLTPEKGRR